MPALLPVPGVARVMFRGSFGASTWANVLHIAQLNAGGAILTAPYSLAEINALATLCRVRWTARFAPQANTSVTLTSTEAVDLTSDTGVVGVDLTNSNGSLAGTQVPAQVSCCVSWREALHYRGGHPRTYLPPCTTSQLLNGTSWTIVYQQAVELAMNNFLVDLDVDTTVNANGVALVGVHRTRNFANIDPPLVTRITSALVDNRIDTQRRRLGPDV